MTDHFQNIYDNHPDDYDLMVSREDYEHNLLPAIRDLTKFDENAVVAEFGAGTGRVTRILAPHVKHIYAFDRTVPMLEVANARAQADSPNATFAAADNRHSALKAGFADFSIEGWSFAHFRGWYPDTWQTEAARAIGEMARVTKSGGTVVLIETLGTGFETPTPPNERIAEFITWLEKEQGFTRTWVRTDYDFATLDEAERLGRFFFGDELGDQIREKGWRILPECTGLWWKRV